MVKYLPAGINIDSLLTTNALQCRFVLQLYSGLPHDVTVRIHKTTIGCFAVFQLFLRNRAGISYDMRRKSAVGI